MKQVQSAPTSRGYPKAGSWWGFGSAVPRPAAMRRCPRAESRAEDRGPRPAWSWLHVVGMGFLGLWFLVTLPFRLVFWTLALLGRITGIAIGFSLMVVGMFFLAGPFFLIGIPLFLVGIVLTLRCLE
ncbi:MAG: hypothetical protein ACYC61_32540 [Isosphaeraceae bacterium]